MTNFKTTAMAALAALSIAAPAFAQEDVDAMSAPVAAAPGQDITLELNTVADTGDACRLTYVATNNTGTDLENASYEMAVFNERGAVSNLLIMEFGALQNERTRVVQFDIANQSCGDISRILVNNQVDCADSEGGSDICMSRLAARTLDTDIVFTE